MCANSNYHLSAICWCIVFCNDVCMKVGTVEGCDGVGDKWKWSCMATVAMRITCKLIIPVHVCSRFLKIAYASTVMWQSGWVAGS